MTEIYSHGKSREDILQALVLRFAHPSNPSMGDMRLLVGQLPENLPFSLPLPEGSLVLGSLVRDTIRTDIALDIPLSPEQAIDFYRDAFHREGLSESVEKRAGFLSANRERTALKVRSEHCAVELQATQTEHVFTSVDLKLSRPLYQLSPDQRLVLRVMPVSTNRAVEHIPLLEAPPATTLRVRVFASTSTRGETSAALRTVLPLGDVAVHYATQLEQAGWTCTGSGCSGLCAWQTWTFQDGEEQAWMGRCFVLQMPDTSGEYALSVQVSEISANSRDWL